MAARPGRGARRAPRRPRGRWTRSSALVAPDGDATYLGRGQDQVWVPALTAAALANGARGAAATDPRRAAPLPRRRRARDPAARSAATRARRASSSSAAQRTTTEGIDGYAHTVAYNGLALFGLTAALDALAAIPAARIGADAGARAGWRSTTRTPAGSSVVATGRIWLAVHRTRDERQRPAPRLRRARAQAPHASAAGSTCSRRAR